MNFDEILSFAVNGIHLYSDELIRIRHAGETIAAPRDEIALIDEQLRENSRKIERILELIPKVQQIRLLPGEMIYSPIHDPVDPDSDHVAAERVTGIGFEGFTTAAILSNPDDMSDIWTWDELGSDAFLTREEAEAQLPKPRSEGEE